MYWMLRCCWTLFAAMSLPIFMAVGFMRMLPLPAPLPDLGFATCENGHCLTRPVSIVELRGTRLTVGWIVAWMGSPCYYTAANGNVLLKYPTAEIYAYGRDIRSSRLASRAPVPRPSSGSGSPTTYGRSSTTVSNVHASDIVWGISPSRTQALVNCRLDAEPWAGLMSESPLGWGAALR